MLKKIEGFIKAIQPSNNEFFGYLEEISRIVRDISETLEDYCTTDADRRAEYQYALNAAKERLDVNIQTLEDALAATFVTPIDRTDIHEIASDLQKAGHVLVSVATHAERTNVALPPQAAEFSNLIHTGSKNVRQMVLALRQSATRPEIRGLRSSVFALERQCDELNHMAQIEVNTSRRSDYTTIKEALDDFWRVTSQTQVLRGLEKAMDRIDIASETIARAATRAV